MHIWQAARNINKQAVISYLKGYWEWASLPELFHVILSLSFSCLFSWIILPKLGNKRPQAAKYVGYVDHTHLVCRI